MLLLFLFAHLSADFIRVESGVRMLYNTNFMTKGKIKDTAIDKSSLNFSDQAIGYGFWAFIKHPTPFLPNLRIAYENHESSGKVLQNLRFLGNNIAKGDKTTFNINTLDFITYYNIVDNLSFTTLDLGLAVRKLGGSLKIGDKTQDLNFYIPNLFVRLRIFTDTLGLGGEAVAKSLFISEKQKLQDFTLSVDYRVLDLPGFDLSAEAGYKLQVIKFSGVQDYNFDYENDNVFLGLVGRF